jgi:hypothetical protein
MNPVADTFIRLGLMPSLISYKLLMILCGFVLLWRCRASRLVIPACWLLLAAYVSLSVIWYVWMSDTNHHLEYRLTNAIPFEP